MTQGILPASRVPSSRRWRLAFWGVAVIVGVVVYFVYDPRRVGFFPPCLTYKFLHFYCPGCGSQRACHELLHGHVVGAMRYNPLLVVMLPLLAWEFGRTHVGRWLGRYLPSLSDRPWRIWALGAIVVAYAILRNVPAYPFNLLAPSSL